MIFAAISTIIAVFENIICFAMDLTGCSRRKAVICNAVAIILLSLPCVLGYNLLERFRPAGERAPRCWIWRTLSSATTCSPLGSLVYLLFCTSRYGWGWKNFVAEADAGQGLKFPKWARFYVTFLLPLIVLYIFVQGYISKFA